jgi:lipopolysaccharide export LptBFGC system permease protein LptF
MPDKRYTKVEEEIIQILDKMDDGAPPRVRPNLRLVKTTRPRRRFHLDALNVSSITKRFPLAFMVLAFVLAIFAISFRDSSPTVATILAVLAALSFFAPLFLSRRPASGSSPIEGKMWRGRDMVVTPPPGQSPVDRARRWFERRQR